MIVLFKIFILLLAVVLVLFAIIFFTMNDSEIHLVEMEFEMEEEILLREKYEQLKKSE